MVITAGEAEDNDYRHNSNHRPPTTAKDRENSMAAMVPERSRGSFSNFSSLPCFNVKWGRQRHLRCVKYSDHDFAASPSSSPFDRRLPPTDFYSDRKRRSTDDGGIEAMREKLMLDFREEVHQIQADFLRKSDVVSTVPSPPLESRPWNLRTRRAVCKEPNSLQGANDRKPNFSPAKQLEVKSPAKEKCGVVDGGDGVNGDGGKGPRAKFSVSLSKHEIEEDFVAILGIRPARRPKKRPKNVQKEIDAVFPGFWLSEITADLYKVNEQP